MSIAYQNSMPAAEPFVVAADKIRRSVRGNDPAALADALAELLADRGAWEARRRRARAFVERERNWSSNISRYEPVYQRLMATAGKGRTWS